MMGGEGPGDTRLALDVAALLMDSWMRRSEAIREHNSLHKQTESKVKSTDGTLSKLHDMQARLKNLCDEHAAMIRSIESEDKHKETNNCPREQLIGLWSLLQELKSELAAPACSGVEGIKDDMNALRNLFDQLIDENMALEERIKAECKSESRLHMVDQLESRLQAVEALNAELSVAIVDRDAQISHDRQVKIRHLAHHQSILALFKDISAEQGSQSTKEIQELIRELRAILSQQTEEISSLTAEAEQLSSRLAQAEASEALKSKRIAELEAECLNLQAQKQQRVADLLEESDAIVRVLNDANSRRVTELQEAHEEQMKSKEAEAELLRSELQILNERLAKAVAESEERRRAPLEDFFKDSPPRQTPPVKRARPQPTPTKADMGKTGSAGSSQPAQVRVVFTGFRDQTGPKSIKHLGGLVERLGGVVHVSDVFSDQITHVVAPKGCSSIKVLAGSLTAKWLMNEDWIIECGTAGSFLPETDFNGRRFVEERPFRGKTFFMTSAFQAQQLRHQFDVSCCRTLIENLGKGKLIRDQTAPADYVLVADSEQTSTQRINLQSFLAMIPGYPTSSSSLRP